MHKIIITTGANGTRAITLWQPHGSLIFLPEGQRKLYETRGWPTSYRGPLVIHAAKSTEDIYLREEDDDFLWPLFRAGLVDYDIANSQYLGHKLPMSAAIDVVDLVGCRETGAWCRELPEPARWFGDFDPGRFAWQLANPRLFPAPVRCPGKQGLWEWKFDLQAALEGHYRPLDAQAVAAQGAATVTGELSLF